MTNRSTTLRAAAAATLGLVCGAGCAGARYDFAAERAQYPISFSPALPDDKGSILYLNRELQSKGEFEIETNKFGFFYSATGGTIDLSDELNDEVRKKGGDGIVELTLKNENCWTNYLFPFQLLPFYPGCQGVTVTGTVVKAKPEALAKEGR
jgi:hypothetical protein